MDHLKDVDRSPQRLGLAHGRQHATDNTNSASMRFKILAKHDTTASEAEAGLSREAEDLTLSEHVLKASFEGFQRIKEDYAELKAQLEEERLKSKALNKRNKELSEQLRVSTRRCKALTDKKASVDYIHQRLCDNFCAAEKVKADNIIDLVRQLKTKHEHVKADLEKKQEEVKRLNAMTKEQRKTFLSARDELKLVRQELLQLREGKLKLQRLLSKQDRECERQLKALQQQAREAVNNAKKVAELALKASSAPVVAPSQHPPVFSGVSKAEIDKLKFGVKRLKSDLASAKEQADRANAKANQDHSKILELSEKLSQVERSNTQLEKNFNAVQAEKHQFERETQRLKECCSSLEHELALAHSHKSLLVNVDKSIASLRASATGERES